MSGWENVPPETPQTPATQQPRKRSVPAAMSEAPAADGSLIEDGEWIQKIEYYWPQIWLGMLSILCALGIYCAVGKLPNAPW